MPDAGRNYLVFLFLPFAFVSIAAFGPKDSRSILEFLEHRFGMGLAPQRAQQ
jgi:hypothetical protein